MRVVFCALFGRGLYVELEYGQLCMCSYIDFLYKIALHLLYEYSCKPVPFCVTYTLYSLLDSFYVC